MYHGLVFLLAVGLQSVHGHLDLILQQSSCTFCAAVLQYLAPTSEERRVLPAATAASALGCLQVLEVVRGNAAGLEAAPSVELATFV